MNGAASSSSGSRPLARVSSIGWVPSCRSQHTTRWRASASSRRRTARSPLTGKSMARTTSNAIIARTCIRDSVRLWTSAATQSTSHPEHGLFHLYGPKRDGSATDGLYFYRFPFLMLNLYQWGSSIATLEPLGAGRVRHVNWYLFSDISPERADENRRSAEWSRADCHRGSGYGRSACNATLPQEFMSAAFSRRGRKGRCARSRTWCAQPFRESPDARQHYDGREKPSMPSSSEAVTTGSFAPTTWQSAG